MAALWRACHIREFVRLATGSPGAGWKPPQQISPMKTRRSFLSLLLAAPFAVLGLKRAAGGEAPGDSCVRCGYHDGSVALFTGCDDCRPRRFERHMRESNCAPEDVMVMARTRRADRIMRLMTEM